MMVVQTMGYLGWTKAHHVKDVIIILNGKEPKVRLGMSRMITKLKAWDKISKKMRAVRSLEFNPHKSYSDFRNKVYDLSSILRKVWLYDEKAHDMYKREPGEVELLWYTGVKDRDDREIHLGDLVEGMMGVIWEIIQEKGTYRTKVRYAPADIFASSWTLGQNAKMDERIKIIGNAYEDADKVKT